jgi:hypothetical protein
MLRRIQKTFKINIRNSKTEVKQLNIVCGQLKKKGKLTRQIKPYYQKTFLKLKKYA